MKKNLKSIERNCKNNLKKLPEELQAAPNDTFWNESKHMVFDNGWEYKNTHGNSFENFIWYFVGFGLTDSFGNAFAISTDIPLATPIGIALTISLQTSLETCLRILLAIFSKILE